MTKEIYISNFLISNTSSQIKTLINQKQNEKNSNINSVF